MTTALKRYRLCWTPDCSRTLSASMTLERRAAPLASALAVALYSRAKIVPGLLRAGVTRRGGQAVPGFPPATKI
jgi:hypothetical protein